MILQPCPFCGSTFDEVDIEHWAVAESRLKPTMEGPGALIAVEIRHWCGGKTKTRVNVIGRDHEEAERNWNRRAG